MKLPEFFGLDFSNHSIKAAQVKHIKQGVAELLKIGQVDTDIHIIDVNKEEEQKKIIEGIKKVRETAKISTKKAVVSLPEAAIFSRLILLPDVDEKKLEKSIYFEAKQYLPLPIDQVQIDWIPVTRTEKKGKKMIQILLVGAPKKLVAKYMEITAAAGLELIAVETDTIASARTLTFKHNFENSILLIDFGGSGTDISVIKGQNVIFSQSIGTGSDVLTKSIASDFNLELDQAEQYKRTYGLLKDQAEGKIFNSLEPVMELMVGEISKTLNYFRAHLQESTPKGIFIVGDGAKLPGLSPYLAGRLGIPTQVTDPVAGLQMSKHLKSETAQLSTVGFTVAVGLALKQE